MQLVREFLTNGKLKNILKIIFILQEYVNKYRIIQLLYYVEGELFNEKIIKETFQRIRMLSTFVRCIGSTSCIHNFYTTTKMSRRIALTA